MDFKGSILTLIKKWHNAARNGRAVAKDVPDDVARGHMYGMSDAFDVAADDMNKLVESPNVKP